MRLVYRSGTPGRLFTRRLDQPKAVELAGTEGALAPFFSPDGLWIGFQRDSKVNKISVDGGAVVQLADVGGFLGASWSEDGSIFLGSRKGLLRIRNAGGEPETIAAAGSGEFVAFPQILPGGIAVLFSVYPTGSDVSSIEVMTLSDRHRKTVVQAGTNPRYLTTSSETAHLIYLNKATLFAIPFDAFSHDGKWLVYHQHEGGSTTMWRLAIDASDAEHPKAGAPQAFLQESVNQEYAAFSPDGRWIAYKARDGGREDVYVRPYPGPGGKWLVSSAGSGTSPVWSSTGHELFYLGSDGRIQVADYTVQGDSFAVGKPRSWSPAQLSIGASQFDVMPDGKRILMALGDVAGQGDRSNTHVTLLLNFFDELRRRAPAGK
jgi:serine/threonine-protein kinase